MLVWETGRKILNYFTSLFLLTPTPTTYCPGSLKEHPRMPDSIVAKSVAVEIVQPLL